MGPDLAPPFTARDEPTRWLFSLNRFGIRPGLDRIQGLLADLGNPERDLRILVTAGTNGKGSTTLVLSHLLQAAGHRTATYTSPHLLNVYERIRIEGRPVDPDRFAQRVTDIKPLVEKNEASWFETLTALAILEARDADVDYVCCETGLGGRLDATNALPALAIMLTTVGLDHQRILGETREEIAAEKLGLLKRGVPLFCGVDEELRPQVFRSAVTSGSHCHFLDELAHWTSGNGEGSTEGVWDLTLRDRVFVGLPDPGTEPMRRNMALAVLALAELEAAGHEGLLPDDLAGSLGNLFLPGRYQRVLTGPDWFVDTAHNEQALERVLAAFAARPGSGRRVLLFGAMADKNLPDELGPQLKKFDGIAGTPVALPRSMTVDETVLKLADWGLALEAWGDGGDTATAVRVAPDMGAALAALAADLGPDDQVLVTGSCFTVAEALHRMGFADLEETRKARPAADLSGTLARTLGKESS